MREFIIKDDAVEQRLDRYLTKLLVGAKKGDIQKWIRKKIVSVNAKKVNPEYRLALDDQIKLFLPDVLLDELMKKQIMDSKYSDLNIVYEDEDILVVDKPMGLLVHPDKNEYKETLSSKVQAYLKHLITPTFTPACVNRLDVNTGGLVLFCKNYESLKYYNELMRKGEIKKRYQCIATGIVEEPIRVEGFLTKDESNNKVKLSPHEREGSKYVLTYIEPLETVVDSTTNTGYSLLDINLVTGRTHQIRASLSYVGHPILGDVKYGGKKYHDIRSQLLFAYKLEAAGRIFEAKNQKMEDTWKKLKRGKFSL